MRWSRPLFDGSFEHSLHTCGFPLFSGVPHARMLACCAHSGLVLSDKMLVFGGLSFASGLVDDFFLINTGSCFFLLAIALSQFRALQSQSGLESRTSARCFRALICAQLSSLLALRSDFTFKLVLVGDSSVGKSCLMTRFEIGRAHV